MTDSENSEKEAPPVDAAAIVIPPSEVNLGDVGTLAMTGTDALPVLTVSGGQVIPQTIPVMDESGNLVAVYAAGLVVSAQSRALADTAADANDEGVVMPQPASRLYGNWSRAQPWHGSVAAPEREEAPTVPADMLSHPDDPVPQARAGYLQLTPTTSSD